MEALLESILFPKTIIAPPAKPAAVISYFGERIPEIDYLPQASCAPLTTNQI